MTREVEKAAAGEASAKSALEEMKRDLDTNTVIMMSLQEQLKERDAQACCTAPSYMHRSVYDVKYDDVRLIWGDGIPTLRFVLRSSGMRLM